MGDLKPEWPVMVDVFDGIVVFRNEATKLANAQV
jgi:hypothetical protein